jgi:PadR family transcriptional regulator PadR
MVLSILQYGDCYGYRLSKLIEEYSEGFIILPVGTLYHFLYRMEEKGYVSFEQRIADKRLRTYYHILDAGMDYLTTVRKEYEDVNRNICQVLDKSVQWNG